MQTLLQCQNLSKYYPIYSGLLMRHSADVKAVESVDLVLPQGKIIGLVGESGCGKSTLGRLLLKLEEPTQGTIHYRGKNLNDLRGDELKAYRRQVQVIFQDPFNSLNPRFTVEEILADALKVHQEGFYDREDLCRVLTDVGLSSDALEKYPHEFSGGQRQRIAIARALVLRPELVICDEAVSALDVSVQSQILNLLVRLKDSYGLSLLFISHDLSVVHYLSDWIAVMYLGEVIEWGIAEELFKHPKHPYTQALLNAQPKIRSPHVFGNDEDLAAEKRLLIPMIQGEIPSPVNPPRGCYFHPRCPMQRTECQTQHFPLNAWSADALQLTRCKFQNSGLTNLA